MAINQQQIEIDLTIRVKGRKHDMYDNPKNDEMKVIEELTFNSLSATSVIRKLLDYIQDT